MANATTRPRAHLTKIVALAARSATLADVWDRLADTYGARTALTLEEPIALEGAPVDRLSYVDLARVIALLAGALVDAGVRAGDRVAVCTANRVDYALTCFAAVRAGAVAVPLHHHLKPAEVEAFLTRSRAGYLVADPSTAVARRGVVTLTTGVDGLLTRALQDASPLPATKVAARDAALILFTSGTTGAPKGATITSRSLLAVARLAALVPDARDERGVCGLPLAHVMGMSTLLCVLLAGAPVHWIAKFDAALVLARLQAQGATFFVGVPAMYALLAEEGPERFDLSSVKLWASGADAMPPALVERFRPLGCALRSPRGRRLLTAAFAEIYGMVELSGPAIVKLTPPGPYDDGALSAPVTRAIERVRRAISARAPELAGARARARAALLGRAAGATSGALGILIPPYRARIVDDAGRPVRAGVVGELELKGPGVTTGYDGDAAATARARPGAWLRTGDLAWRNRAGLIAFATRMKDVIKHGGYSVFPAEVEAQLGAHPQVAEAVVFGVPHKSKGAVPAAAVVLKKGAHIDEAALIAWAREHIAPFKAPRLLAIVTSADVPRNANRKVLKDELRSRLLASGALVSA
ncbi:MAG: AMP-binding protein [Deltaproteobacteria bacterium]|nr:AMP-binding protein [Deltaproteobacteria bacterium]